MAIVRVTVEATEQAGRLPKEIQGRIRNAIQRLANWPTVTGVKRLKGNLTGWYRIRVGNYRVRFHVVGETVTVDKIGDRKDVYEG